jgi:anti-anti-sigma factor
VSFCDSAGLNVLLAARREAEGAGLKFVLSCLPGRLRRILELTGADRVLHVFDTLAEAEAALSR